MSHTVDSLTVQSRQDDDKRKGSLANQQLQKQGSDKWHPAQTVNSSFFFTICLKYGASHFALLCCKKIRIPSNLHYRKRDVSTQLLHCRIHTWNFVFIGNTKSSREVYQYLFWLLLLTQYSDASTQKQTRTRQPTSFFEAGCYSECKFWRNFLFFKLPRPAPGPTQTSIKPILGILSSGVKVDHEVTFSHTLPVTDILKSNINVTFSPSLCHYWHNRTEWLTNRRLQTTCGSYSHRSPKA